MAKKTQDIRPKKLRPLVPKEYQGKWITWNQKQSQILSSGDTLEQARDSAIVAGEPNPILEWVPPGLVIGFRR